MQEISVVNDGCDGVKVHRWIGLLLGQGRCQEALSFVSSWLCVALEGVRMGVCHRVQIRGGMPKSRGPWVICPSSTCIRGCFFLARFRWKALKSVENYLQQGRAIMIKYVEACRRIVALGSSIEAVFEVVFSLGFPAQ